MRKFVFLALVNWGVLLVCDVAMAQSIQGRWQNVGGAANGSRYIATVVFSGNGTFQYQMGHAAGPGMSGSGVTNCSGRYQFDGRSLATSGGCTNGVPLSLGGPTQMMNQNTINIAGDIWRRQ